MWCGQGLQGTTAAVGIDVGTVRVRVYEQQGNGDWNEAAALTEDDLCPGKSHC